MPKSTGLTKKTEKSVPEVVLEETAPSSSSSNKGLTCLIIGCVSVILLSMLAAAGVAVFVVLKVKSDPSFLSTMIKISGVQTELPVTQTPTPSLSTTVTSTPTGIIVMTTPLPTTGQVSRENAGDFVLSFSSTERVVRNDLLGLTPWNLKVARNEIYARHGRPFVSKDLTCYFATKSWYVIDSSYTDARLTKLELENAVFILNYEKSVGSPIYDKDTGCTR